jgi:hypothetical protein
MRIMDDYGFQITLVSNASKSMDMYPDNTVAKFRTQLFNEVCLSGDHEIALTEIQCPISFHNITMDEYSVHNALSERPEDGIIRGDPDSNEIKLNGGRRIWNPPTVHSLTPGFYAGIQEITNQLSNIDDESFKNNQFTVTYDSERRRVKVINQTLNNVTFSEKLRTLLGFDKRTVIVPRKDYAPYPVNLFQFVPRQMFVYCDLVEPQLVGDTRSSLLRVVGLDNVEQYGKHFTRIYDNPEYLPLMKNSFDTIEIDIRTFEDKPMPFQFGPSLVKVRIRPVSRLSYYR